MGVGMTVILPSSSATDVISAAATQGCRAWRIGEVRGGSGRVELH
jgi:phosphoribosylaminoimidazole (AIR) synthetase